MEAWLRECIIKRLGRDVSDLQSLTDGTRISLGPDQVLAIEKIKKLEDEPLLGEGYSLPTGK